jgi:hypothetical protein
MYSCVALMLACVLLFLPNTVAGQSAAEKVEFGSQTAKNGFLNETEVAGKFNNWKQDETAKTWLTFMGYKLAEIESVIATKPHGQKADVEVRIMTAKASTTEGISIKLVSSPNGFNQIDKRWLSHYAAMWKMPADVLAAMKLFVGESKPEEAGRDPARIYLDELDAGVQKKIVDYFSMHKDEIVSDLFEGDGVYSAKWIVVAQKTTDKPRWVLRSMSYAKEFFGAGEVGITARGNLKIGRITAQRKGGDGGRETAKMLQFKINPALLFDGK